MTVLGKRDIQSGIVDDSPPLVQRDDGRLAIEPASLDVHLADTLLIEAGMGQPIDVTDENTYPDYYEREMQDGYTIDSQSFVLATTEETVTLPNGIVGYLHGRSSVGRLGMFIENAGLIDPGYGYDSGGNEITLELFNASQNAIRLQEGMRIGQITFHEVGTAPDIAYSSHNGNKYIDQCGPTPSRLWEDFE